MKKETYSKTATVQYTDISSHLSVFPNPVSNGRLSVKVNKWSSVMVVNNVGIIVKEQQMRAGINQLDLENLPKGIYRLKSGLEVVSFVIQ